MDSASTSAGDAVTHALRAMASKKVKQEEVEYVAELLLVVQEENASADASALAGLVEDALLDVRWIDAAARCENSKALVALLTGSGSDSDSDDEKQADPRTLKERVLLALQQEYALGKDCLAVLTEDGEWHPARITAHCPVESQDSDQAETAKSRSHEDAVALRLEVEFIEFGKKQRMGLDEIVLDEDVAELDDDDESREGHCEMCERLIRLSFHHLTPRETHARYLKKGFTKEFLNLGVMICRPCHSKIHSSESNKTLARDFNTLPRLLAHPEIARWVNYARKQRVSIKPPPRRKQPRDRRRQ